LSRLLDSSTELLFRRAWHTYKQSMRRVLDGFVLRVWQSLLKLYTGLSSWLLFFAHKRTSFLTLLLLLLLLGERSCC
jgi:hypothetical protein